MRRTTERAAEWLASNPWALVGVVAVVVVIIPILLLGETSASDMQRRLRAERLALGAQAADRGAEEIQTQLSLSLQQLKSRGDRVTLTDSIRLRDKTGVKLALTSPDWAGSLTDISAIDVGDLAGTVLATVTAASGFRAGTAPPAVDSVTDREYFRLARAGSSTIAGVTTPQLMLDNAVIVAAPVKPQGSDSVVGVLIGET